MDRFIKEAELLKLNLTNHILYESKFKNKQSWEEIYKRLGYIEIAWFRTYTHTNQDDDFYLNLMLGVEEYFKSNQDGFFGVDFDNELYEVCYTFISHNVLI